MLYICKYVHIHTCTNRHISNILHNFATIGIGNVRGICIGNVYVIVHVCCVYKKKKIYQMYHINSRRLGWAMFIGCIYVMYVYIGYVYMNVR